MREESGESDRSNSRWLVTALLATPVLLTLTATQTIAHGGTLRAATQESLDIPTWLFLSTGGAVVVASFLLASLMTDRGFIRRAHALQIDLDAPRWTRNWVPRLGALVGNAALGVVLWGGFYGPEDPLSNPAIMLVWAGWWAGFAMSTYLVGNSWPLLNPWRAIVVAVPASLDVEYPRELGTWASVAGLLALVWVEVVSPLADDAELLALTVLGYSAVTLAGAFVFGPGDWFERVDPVARVFRFYGWVAPVSRGTDGSLSVAWPGARLTHPGLISARGDVAFVIALLWGTTYDGLVGTPTWAGVTRDLVGAGFPPVGAYLLPLIVGFALFYGAYLAAAAIARKAAGTYLAEGVLAERFAPPLLAIAAGYHLAHFLGYFIALLPVLVTSLGSVPGLDMLGAAAPAGGASPLTLPGWFGVLSMAFVLVGHLLAIWVAHATAYDLFPSRLQAVRSQVGFTGVMVLYTMASLWIVSQPSVALPYVSG